jgi:hypothetical protein
MVSELDGYTAGRRKIKLIINGTYAVNMIPSLLRICIYIGRT